MTFLFFANPYCHVIIWVQDIIDALQVTPPQRKAQQSCNSHLISS